MHNTPSYNDFDIQVNRCILANGLPVLFFYKRGMPIHIEIKFANGSRYDPIGKEGLAHFVEHMIVAGSEKFPSKDKLAMSIEDLGGIFGASTSNDVISIFVEVAGSEDLKEGISILNEILLHSLFSDKSIATEREAILKEIGEKISNPSRFIWDIYSELFFQRTEVGRSNLGTEQSLTSITKNDLLNYYNEMFMSGRAVLVACGDVEFKKFSAVVENVLPLKNSQKFIFPNSLPFIREKKKISYVYPKQDQIQIIIGFRTTDRKNDARAALDILSTIYGGGRASILNRKLRYDKGLVYGVGTSSHTFVDGGSWTVKTSTSKNKVQEVVDIITNEFENIFLGKISENELNFAKNKLIKSSKRIMQTSSSWVNAHSYNELIGNKVQLFDYLEQVNNLTIDELSEVGKNFFVKDSWFLALCGDITEDSVNVNY